MSTNVTTVVTVHGPWNPRENFSTARFNNTEEARRAVAEARANGCFAHTNTDNCRHCDR